VQQGDYLPVSTGLDIQAMIAQATEMLDEAKGTVANMRSITDKLNEGDGDIARLLNENYITTSLQSATERIHASLSDMNQITGKINNGQGDLGKLVNSDSLTTNLNSIMGNLNSTTLKADSLVNELYLTSYTINNGDGVLPRLLHDKQMGLNVDTAIAKVDQSLIEVTKAAETISNSWLFRLFSKKKKNNQDEESLGKLEVNAGDTIIIRRENTSELPNSIN
jgi:phospholipid/cholesterol/gamma-HCH transport system substrate-binding protein